MKTYVRYIIYVVLAVVVPMGVNLQAQTVSQKGVSYRYNGKNKRTPLGGVYIKAMASDGGEVSDDKNGTFTLELKDLKMGSMIGKVRVTKQGMMVFNQQAVDDWTVRKEPLCLILCDANEFQKQKDNLIAMGRNQAKKKYDKKLAELKKQNDDQKLKIDTYYSKLDSLEKEFQNAMQNMDKYADVFARIDESEVDTVAQRAIELFNRGEIEESLRLLEEQNYMEKIKKAIRIISQGKEMITTGERAITLGEQDKEKALEGIKTQIAAYKLQNEWDKAGQLLKELADNLNTLEAMWDYAIFCYNQNDFTEAERYIIQCKELIEQSEDMEKSRRIYFLAEIHRILGKIYNLTQRYESGWLMYNSAFEIIGRGIKFPNAYVFLPLMANLGNNIGNLLRNEKRFNESEKAYKSSLECLTELLKVDSLEYERNIAQVQYNLGELYLETRRFAESEEMFKSALEVREKGTKSNPKIYESELAYAQGGLADLYRCTLRYAEGEKLYKSSLEILERLSKSNPFAYELGLTKCQIGLADLYHDMNRCEDSEKLYKSSLKIRKHLAKSNPSAYESSLALNMSRLALLYVNIQNYVKSERLFKEAIEIYKRLIKANQRTFEADIAHAYNNLALLYRVTHRYAEGEEACKFALEILERLSNLYPSIYEPNLASAQMNLANIYNETKRYRESETLCISAIKIYKRLVEVDSDLFESDLVYTQYCLSQLYLSMELYNSAYGINKELLDRLERLYGENRSKWGRPYVTQLTVQSALENFSGKFKEGEKYSLEALKVDSNGNYAYTNLAPALLFQGKVQEAEELYRKYKVDFKDAFLDDFAEFERLGVIPEERKADVERIKAMLNEESNETK